MWCLDCDCNVYNFSLSLSLSLSFAVDQAVSSNSTLGALRIIDVVQTQFEKIGLEINPKKSIGIMVQNGELVPGALELTGQAKIKCINHNEVIRYLGCTFKDELVFDESIMTKFTNSCNQLISSPLLKKNQKLSILNQYLLPMLIYPVQSAPLNKIPTRYVEGLDLTIRTTVKAIIGLPTSTSSDMIYSPKKFRGLGIMNLSWEIYLQHISISLKLIEVPDQLFHAVVDCQNEIDSCKSSLQVDGNSSKQLRAQLREKAFNNWAALDYQGIGVKHFSNQPRSNSALYKKSILSASEWTAALKLNVNYANLNGVPGSSNGQASILCRRCGRERETPSHVLGACPFGELRRIQRHDKIKNKLADVLREKNIACHIEVACKDKVGSNRRVDILAYDPRSKCTYIIDPTIRFETNEDVGGIVQAEKEAIYSGCSDDLKKCFPQYSIDNIEIYGLWFGARGTISTQVVSFFSRFGLDESHLAGMAESVVIDSIKMIHHHIYASN